MGGSIRVIIREEDGKVHKMIRWTNQLPHFVKNKKFFDGDKEHIKEYVNRGDGYTHHDNIIAPDGYGITVFDFMNKKIFNMQGYCSYEDISDSELYMGRDMENKDERFNSYKAGVELFEAGYLKYRKVTYNKDDYRGTYNIEDMEPIPLDDFIEQRWGGNIIKGIRNMFGQVTNGKIVTEVKLEIDYEKLGWELIDNHREDADELFRIYEKMYENGFEFTYEDNKVWEERMREQEEYWDGEGDFPYKEGVFLGYKRKQQLNEILD
jgi:hypothetical protein